MNVQKGASNTEYALILGLIVILAIPAVLLLGSNISEVLGTNADSMESTMALMSPSDTPGQQILQFDDRELPTEGTLTLIKTPNGDYTLSLDVSTPINDDTTTNSGEGNVLEAHHISEILANQIYELSLDPAIDDDTRLNMQALAEKAMKLAETQHTLNENEDAVNAFRDEGIAIIASGGNLRQKLGAHANAYPFENGLQMDYKNAHADFSRTFTRFYNDAFGRNGSYQGAEYQDITNQLAQYSNALMAVSDSNVGQKTFFGRNFKRDNTRRQRAVHRTHPVDLSNMNVDYSLATHAQQIQSLSDQHS